MLWMLLYILDYYESICMLRIVNDVHLNHYISANQDNGL